MTAEPVEDVEVRDNPAAHRFELRVGSALAGVLRYRVTGAEQRALDHTEVEPQFEGQGLARRLVGEVLDTARADGWSVLPYCPFVRSYLDKHPVYAELVPPEKRADFGL
jgi:predicted GNAT family acetyltransferase